MIDLVVTDTSCLIALDRVGHLEILPALFTVHAPRTVADEFGKRLPWLRVEDVSDVDRVGDLLAELDRGEAEAVVLALSYAGARLLVDERKGRQVAQRLGLEVTGTAGVLLAAKKAELVSEVGPILRELVEDHAFRLGRSQIDTVLRQAGER